MVKLVSIVGVVKPLESCFSMADIEREEDKDYSFSRRVFTAPSVFYSVLMARQERTGNPARRIASEEQTG